MEERVHELSSVWFLSLLQGLSLIVLGVLVLLNPAILAALAPVFFIWVGAATLVLALRVWRFEHRYESFKRAFEW
jgi:uncharacterized membrane protein HdeD (DUF308 family)